MTTFEASEHPEIDEIIPYELAIHKRTNQTRKQRTIEPLVYDSQLAYVSRRYSQTMAVKNEFGHSVGSESPVERLWKYNIDCSDVGENLNLGELNDGKAGDLTARIAAESTVNSWLNSDEGHRENLLNDEWEYEGVGVYVTADAKVYVTQTFTARDCDGPGDPPRYDGEYDG